MRTTRAVRRSSTPPNGKSGDAPVQGDFVGKTPTRVGPAAGRHDVIANSLTSYSHYRRWADQMKRSWNAVAVKS